VTALERAVAPEDFAAGLSDRILRCRELGHQWRPHTAAWDATARVFDRTLRCSSCRTVRRQTLNSRGHVLSNAYTYPSGYLITAATVTDHPGIGAFRDMFRLESLRRSLGELPVFPDPKPRGLRTVS
jgi:hypothetical protein